jgi:glucose/arabinose dehydrogenase
MNKLALVLFAGLLFAIACSGDSNDNNVTSTPISSSGANGAAPTPAPTPSGGDASGPLPEVNLQRVFGNVSIDQPTGLVPAPDGSWWAIERAGRVLRFENRNDASASVVLDISDRLIDSGAEQGLLGIAFAPDFGSSRAFYLNYTAPSPLRTVVSRFIANANGTSSVRGSEAVILTIADFASNHNGGQMAFGNDGYLYFSIGDGGGGNDPQANGQNLNAMLGKIHRIDVSKPSGNLPYTVPPDNPFAGRNDARGEVWAYGLRNPWRFSFDMATGQMWAGDVGQNAREEVDLITKGGNYGWKTMEGTQCLSGNSCDRTGLVLPVIDYGTSGGRCSVTGGYVYRGSAIPSLRGAYVYGDYCSGEIWALRYDGAKVTEQAKIAELDGQLSTFAQGPDGEIYALSYANNGGIFKLTAK